MRVAIEYQADRLEFDVPRDRLLGAWRGPEGVEPGRVRGLAAEALADPRGYPALRLAVVPGDRVAIALDPATPQLGPILAAVLDVLGSAGVEARDVRVVAASAAPEGWADDLPPGVEWSVHDPEDQTGIAYLATTPAGRRVYLNRHLTDADFLLAIGRFTFDAATGYRGPWSTIFPDLSNAETRQEFRAEAAKGRRRAWDERSGLAESVGVSWLLGSGLQLGVLPAADGLADLVAGTEAELQEEGRRALEASWTFRPEGRADLVVVGLGSADRPTGFDELADGLATAAGLVRPGGKIAVLSHVAGGPGPALGRLIGVDEPGERTAALRGAEAEADYPAAVRIAEALAAARVYLYSDLDEQAVDDLGMAALGRPAEVQRLVDAAGSALFVNRAEITRAVLPAEAD